MDEVDEVIQSWAMVAEVIYERRTAGDHTWSGFLSEFLTEVDKARESVS